VAPALLLVLSFRHSRALSHIVKAIQAALLSALDGPLYPEIESLPADKIIY
jgi:hypothetical protein